MTGEREGILNYEYHIKKPYASIKEVKGLSVNNENTLRIWCDYYPDSFAFQIRTFEPITDYKGKPRNMIATISLTIAEVEEILKQMKLYSLKHGFAAET